MSLVATPQIGRRWLGPSGMAHGMAIAIAALGLVLVMIGVVNIAQGLGASVIPVALGLGYAAGAVVVWRHGGERPSRWAWIAVAVLPVALATTLVVYMTVADLLGLDWSEPSRFTGVQYLVVSGSAMLVLLAPPVAGTILAVTAARSGSRSGVCAAIVNGLIAAAIAVRLGASVVEAISRMV